MSGSEGKRVVAITARDRGLLESLVHFRVVDRDQAMQLAGFNSRGVANKRFLKLVRAALLNRFFMPTRAGGVGALYTLSAKAIQLIGANVRPLQRKSGSLLTTDLFAVHQLAINSVLLKAKQANQTAEAVRLLTFRLPLSKSIPLIPDAYFELNTSSGVNPMFLEVDLGNESLKILEKKVLHYIALATSGEYQRLFKNLRFRVLLVVSSERRMGSMQRMILKHTNKLFWFSTLNAINSEGLFAPIWLRPEGEERQSLL
jgi:Replication-relaxation